MSEESKEDDSEKELKFTGKPNGNNEESKSDSISEDLGNQNLAPQPDLKSETTSEDLNEPSLKKKIKK